MCCSHTGKIQPSLSHTSRGSSPTGLHPLSKQQQPQAAGLLHMSLSTPEEQRAISKHQRRFSGDHLSMSMGQLRVVCSHNVSGMGDRAQEAIMPGAASARVPPNHLECKQVSELAQGVLFSDAPGTNQAYRTTNKECLDACRSSQTSTKSQAFDMRAMDVGAGVLQSSMGMHDAGSASGGCVETCVTDSCHTNNNTSSTQNGRNMAESLVELFTDPSLVVTKSGTVVTCNRAFLSLLGMKTRSMAVTKQFPRDFLLDPAAPHSTGSSGMTLRGEDGSPIPVSTTYQTSDVLTEGQQLAVVKDLTKEMQKDEELREARAVLEGAMKVRTQFLDKMSHELRTPLNGVVGVVDLLLSSTQVTNEQQAYLSTIRSSAETLLAVLSDILDMCDIESSRITVRPQVYSLHGVLQEASGILTSLAAAKQLKVSTRVAKDVPELMEGDSQRLLQILRHLISNAVKFTNQGSISLEVSSARPPHDVTDVTDQSQVTASPSKMHCSSGQGSAGLEGPVQHCTTCSCSRVSVEPVAATASASAAADALARPPCAHAEVSRKRSLDSAMEMDSGEMPEETPRKVPRVEGEQIRQNEGQDKSPNAVGVEKATRQVPEYVQFVVRDSGLGFQESDLDRIFQPFMQGDDSHSRIATGAGLGLAITRSLVATMRGKIQVSSIPGTGSAFTIILPMKRAGTTLEPVALKHAGQCASPPLKQLRNAGRLSTGGGVVSWTGEPNAKPDSSAVSGSPNSVDLSSSSLHGSSQLLSGPMATSDDAASTDKSGEARPRLRAIGVTITEDKPGVADLLAACQGESRPLARPLKQEDHRSKLSSPPLHPLDCRRPGMVASISKARSQNATSSDGPVVAGPTRGGLKEFVDMQSRAQGQGNGASPMAVEKTVVFSPPKDTLRVLGTPPANGERKPTSQLEQALATVPVKLRNKFLQPWVMERVKALRCLIAEDNPVNRMVLQRMLRLVDLTCDHAKNGAEAVQACQGKNYDIVFMDCQMPVMDGFEASRAIRGAKPRSCTRTQALCGGALTRSTDGLDLSFSVLRKTPVPGLESNASRNTLATGKVRLSSGTDVTFEHHASGVVGQGVWEENGEEAMMDIFRITCKPSLEVDLGAGCSQGSCFWGSCECCPTVIAVTANVLQGSPGRCREAGMNGFIAKPVRLADVLHVLLRCMGVEP